MCRLLFLLKEDLISDDKIRFERSLRLMKNGGPDFSQITMVDNMLFGHNRLAILDLEERSNQPFNFDGNILIYNGEIYNFIELRDYLELKYGAKFSTKSDTEVLAQGLHYEKEKFLFKIEGMFAFVYRSIDGDILLGRDRFGVKPLYYVNRGGELVISSEEIGLLDYFDYSLKVDGESIIEFLSVGYVSNSSVYEEIHEIPPGCYVHMGRHSKDLYYRSYILDDISNDVPVSRSSNSLIDILTEAVRSRSVADVELAITFSGGIDSTLISFFLNRLSIPFKAFTITFKEQKAYSESSKANLISSHLGFAHRVVEVDYLELAEFLASNPFIYASPVGDISYLPLCYLYNQIDNEGYKVILGGDGADELFGGYSRYLFVKYLARLPKEISKLILVFSEIILRMKITSRFVSDTEIKREKISYFLNGLKTNNSMYNLSKGFKMKKSANDPVKIADQCQADQSTYMPHNILKKTDISSMRFGVEAREPFLHTELWRYSMKLKDKQMATVTRGKKPLRDILSSSLPREIWGQTKKGFTMDTNELLRSYCTSDLNESIVDRTFIDKYQLEGITEYEEIKKSIISNCYNSIGIWFYFVLYKHYKFMQECQQIKYSS